MYVVGRKFSSGRVRVGANDLRNVATGPDGPIGRMVEGKCLWPSSSYASRATCEAEHNDGNNGAALIIAEG
jgi:hypothetical protein